LKTSVCAVPEVELPDVPELVPLAAPEEPLPEVLVPDETLPVEPPLPELPEVLPLDEPLVVFDEPLLDDPLVVDPLVVDPLLDDPAMPVAPPNGLPVMVVPLRV
jgi:hypothetical protein